MSAPETFHGGRITLWPGDCLATLDALPENSVDSCCTDPPYHLHSIVKRFGAEGAAPAKPGKTGAYARASKGFMGRSWDGGDIAFRVETWAGVLRVLKPGAYIVAFSSSRTFGRMSVAIEDAGFITHPMIGWLFGTGFPKATRIQAPGYDGQRYGAQALKPSLEPIYVGQKPFSEANGTANMLRWGTGALRIDDCRVATEGGSPSAARRATARATGNAPGRPGEYGNTIVNRITPEAYMADRPGEAIGRWPPNLVRDGSPEVVALFPKSASGGVTHQPNRNGFSGNFGSGTHVQRDPDSGSAARFFPAFPLTEADCAFYSSKADADDRLGSSHATVKPLDLMRWLVRLVTPRGGITIDPFAGTGTTGHAALIEGCRAILCEADPEHCEDIRRRMSLVYSGRDERARKLAIRDDAAGPLFSALA